VSVDVDGALLVSAAGVIVGLVIAMTSGSLRAAIPPMLELFTAAGLLRLGADARWPVLATAPVIVLLRRLVIRGLRRPRTA
jgi:hypothetical protein